MAPLIVHNLGDEVREKLRQLAEQHGQSVEDEARDILHAVVVRSSGKPAEAEPRPADQNAAGGLGSHIAARFAGQGFQEGEIKEWRGNPIQPAECDE